MTKSIYIYILLLLSIPLTSMTISAETTPPDLISQGAVLMDGDTGQILYSKNPHQELAPASITKLMTALLVLENMTPSDTITFSRNAVMSIEAGSSHIGMREGETITVEDALHGLLLESANEVANGLAEAVSGSIEAFAVDMNKRAFELGATDTNFTNPHGLYEEDHYTTAYDMALITKALLKQDYFLEIMSHPKWEIGPTNLEEETRYLHQNHKLLNPYKDPDLYREDAIAGKTGYTVKSGHTLVTVAKQNGRTLIAVSLKTDANHLYSDTNDMLAYGFESFESLTLSLDRLSYKETVIDENGDAGSVTLAPALPAKCLVPIGTSADDITVTKTIITPPSSNSRIGDIAGEVTYNLGDLVLGSSTLLVAGLDLPQKTLTASVNKVNETPDKEAEVKKSGFSLIVKLSVFFLLLTLMVAALYMFYRRDQRKRMSYRQYKAMRDAEKNTL